MAVIFRTPGPGRRSEPGAAPARPLHRVLGLNALIALSVWTVWLALGRGDAIDALTGHWRISLTMVFGSLVGGGTSEGGGAVAFPIFTKVLSIPAPDARLFTYLIQSVGMSAASLSILYARVPIANRALALAAPAGVTGAVVSILTIAPHVSAPQVRIYFTVLLTALAAALIVMNLSGVRHRNLMIPRSGPTEAAVLILAGFVGGLVSGTVGVGENTVTFLVLVLLFRLSEKVATPTTVILMTVVSIAAALTHLLIARDVSHAAVQYWLAAVPVVVVGAPLGAVICAGLSRHIIQRILILLIGVELVSTLLLIPIPRSTLVVSCLLLTGLTGLGVAMTRIARYDPPTTEPSRSAQAGSS